MVNNTNMLMSGESDNFGPTHAVFNFQGMLLHRFYYHTSKSEFPIKQPFLKSNFTSTPHTLAFHFALNARQMYTCQEMWYHPPSAKPPIPNGVSSYPISLQVVQFTTPYTPHAYYWCGIQFSTNCLNSLWMKLYPIICRRAKSQPRYKILHVQYTD